MFWALSYDLVTTRRTTLKITEQFFTTRRNDCYRVHVLESAATIRCNRGM